MYNRIIGFIGPTGSGKSYCAGEHMKNSPCVAVYQVKTLGEEIEYAKHATAIFREVRGKEGMAMAMCEEQFKLIYLAGEPTGQERNRFIFADFDTFVECCYVRGGLLMIVDEAHLVCDSRYVPIIFRRSVVMGRSRYVDIDYVCQRPAQIHHDILANTHFFCLWHLHDPPDIEAIRLRCGDEMAYTVTQLKPSYDGRRDGGEFEPGDKIWWPENPNVIAEETSETPKEGKTENESSPL